MSRPQAGPVLGPHSRDRLAGFQNQRSARSLVARFAIGLVLGLVLETAVQQTGTVLWPVLAAIPVAFLVQAGVLTFLLPTTFPRGLVVALFNMLISLLIGAVLVGLAIALEIGLDGRPPLSRPRPRRAPFTP
jgi:hypothetical protein